MVTRRICKVVDELEHLDKYGFSHAVLNMFGIFYSKLGEVADGEFSNALEQAPAQMEASINDSVQEVGGERERRSGR